LECSDDTSGNRLPSIQRFLVCNHLKSMTGSRISLRAALTSWACVTSD
jgi:hypothetical protein